MTAARKSGLSTRDIYALDRAVATVVPSEWGTYLVGTAQTGGDYRDVDVRTILADDVFDRVFADGDVWQCWCFLVCEWLSRATGLPVDYQVQRMTEAARHDGPRNPLGFGRRVYAGGGDATPFDAYGARR